MGLGMIDKKATNVRDGVQGICPLLNLVMMAWRPKIKPATSRSATNRFELNFRISVSADG